jgi:hypothetical protein
MDPSLGLSELGRENQIVASVIFDIAKSPTGVSMNLLSKSIIAKLMGNRGWLAGSIILRRRQRV